MKLSPRELIDVAQRYYPRQDREKEAALPPPEYSRYLQSTPEYQAWTAKRKEAFAAWDDWRAFVRRLQAELGDGFDVEDGTAPPDSSFHALIHHQDEPEPAHGVIYTTLVVRVSMLAPVYDIYESKKRVVMVGPKQDRMQFVDRSLTHDIDPGFRRAADAWARAVEAERGHQRLWPDILDIRILHLEVDDRQVNQATLGDALLGSYRW